MKGKIHRKEFFMRVGKKKVERKKAKCHRFLIARETSMFFKVTA